MAKRIIESSIDHHIEQRTLSRSFATIGEAEKFAEGKTVTDIYRAHGRFTVEWIMTKRVEYDENGFAKKEGK